MSANGRTRQGVIFLTLPPALGRGLLSSARKRFPDVSWTVYLRDEHRESLARELEGMCLLRDKPMRGRLRFLKEIRSGRFGVAIVGWAGHAEFNRMKLVALLSGAREKHVYNENLDSFLIQRGKNPIWLQHVRWRLRSGRSGLPRELPLRRMALVYQWSFGLLLGALRLWFKTIVHQTRRSTSA